MGRAAEVRKMIPIPPQFLIAGAIAIAGATTGFGAAWKWQSAKLTDLELSSTKQEKQRAEIALENQRLVAAARTRNDQAVIAAASAGVVRGIALRRDSDAARGGLVSLRDDTQAFVRNAAAEPATCPDRTATLGELFNTMAAAGGEFTQKADHHVNDIRTMREAAPKLIHGPDQ